MPESAAVVKSRKWLVFCSESKVYMDTTTILTEIGKLPVAEQVVLVQRVWDGIADSDTPLELTDVQRAEISRRSAELDANPDIAVPWEEVKRSLEERHRG
jgi:putative addiction module component (TIGR02574 family)